MYLLYKTCQSVYNSCEVNIMKGIWDNSEVKELFDVVEDYKTKNKSLKLAFALHAQKYGRKPNSVRNYYYHEIDNLKSDDERLEKLGINLQLHKKTSVVYFSPEEEEELLNDIDEMVKKGVSVRKSCLTLSGGDINQMLRFQNKYRNFLAKNKKDDGKNIQEQNKSDLPSNIVTFKKMGKTLSDSEVQSLFMGLVRLVKRNAIEESDYLYREKLEMANNNLRKMISKLDGKEREYEKLKKEYDFVKNENNRLINLNFQLRCDKAEELKNKIMKTTEKGE